MGDNWEVVVKSGEKDIVVKRIVAGFFPFLPGASILSSGNNDEVSNLDEDSESLELFNLATIVQVDQDNLGSVQVDAVD